MRLSVVNIQSTSVEFSAVEINDGELKTLLYDKEKLSVIQYVSNNKLLKKGYEKLKQTLEYYKELSVNLYCEKQYVISSWEIGRSEPSINQLIILADIFKVPTDYLLDKDVIIVSSEAEFNIVTTEMVKDAIDEFEECIENIRQNCSNEQKKEISNILKSLYKMTNQ